jgi:hypothetical protein
MFWIAIILFCTEESGHMSKIREAKTEELKSKNQELTNTELDAVSGGGAIGDAAAAAQKLNANLLKKTSDTANSITQNIK